MTDEAKNIIRILTTGDDTPLEKPTQACGLCDFTLQGIYRTPRDLFDCMEGVFVQKSWQYISTANVEDGIVWQHNTDYCGISAYGHTSLVGEMEWARRQPVGEIDPEKIVALNETGLPQQFTIGDLQYDILRLQAHDAIFSGIIPKEYGYEPIALLPTLKPGNAITFKPFSHLHVTYLHLKTGRDGPIVTQSFLPDEPPAPTYIPRSIEEFNHPPFEDYLRTPVDSPAPSPTFMPTTPNEFLGNPCGGWGTRLITPPRTPEYDPISIDPDEGFRSFTTIANGKKFMISTSAGSQSLRQATQLLITVTPRSQSGLFVEYTPLAWKVLDFASSGQYELNGIPSLFLSLSTCLSSNHDRSPAFAVNEHNKDSDQFTPVTPGEARVLQKGSRGMQWMPMDFPGQQQHELIAQNESGIPQTLILGSVHTMDPQWPDETDVFEGFVVFHVRSREVIVTEPAVMLQVYNVTGYTPGQPLRKADSSAFLFKGADQQAKPIDLTTLQDGTSFLLSSGSSGELSLEYA
ncbi:hypothetical protein NLI96_g8800 [Meripilus lineatus]|uniref:Uncharacterized protein n=1 Tax=Meripilus lineatus TaxID=2056292 RepID=A0AAD5YFY7_9APHY|nr:hypothetical protein NLI96_g8800 [Physisporinus lineatus]